MSLQDSKGTKIYYIGPDLNRGPLPAFFYFALSGQESLTEHPYNQPALHVTLSHAIRVFSFTIPGHEEGLNKFHAMQYWAEHLKEGILERFFKQVCDAIQWLIEQEIVDPKHMAVGGLSRGGFIATHIAAREERIQTLLGFAPLTDLMQLKEFIQNPALAEKEAEELNLVHLIDKLAHLHNIRFYIGNRDTRVDTDTCYRFMRQLVEVGFEKRVRHQNIELFMMHSIGLDGHGTASATFQEGSAWVQAHLLQETKQ